MPIPDSHIDLLKGPSFAHVATIGPDGEPQSNPVWIEWDGTHIRISQTTGRQKYRNIQRDPRVAVSMIDLDNPYRYLEVRGQVARIEADPDNELIDRLATKYLGVDQYPYHQPGDERVAVLIEPEHTTTMG